MQSKLDHLERTILELGAQVYRTKHQMDEITKINACYVEIFASLKRLLDERGIISSDDFEEAIAIDKILKLQGNSPNPEGLSVLTDDLKKVVN